MLSTIMTFLKNNVTFSIIKNTVEIHCDTLFVCVRNEIFIPAEHFASDLNVCSKCSMSSIQYPIRYVYPQLIINVSHNTVILNISTLTILESLEWRVSPVRVLQEDWNALCLAILRFKAVEIGSITLSNQTMWFFLFCVLRIELKLSILFEKTMQ